MSEQSNNNPRSRNGSPSISKEDAAIFSEELKKSTERKTKYPSPDEAVSPQPGKKAPAGKPVTFGKLPTVKRPAGKTRAPVPKTPPEGKTSPAVGSVPAGEPDPIPEPVPPEEPAEELTEEPVQEPAAEKKQPSKKTAPKAEAKKPNRKKKKKKKTGRILALVAAVLLIAALLIGVPAAKDARALLDSASRVETQALQMVDQLKGLQLEEAVNTAVTLRDEITADREILRGKRWQFARSVPVAGGDIENADRLLGIAEEALNELFFPTVEGIMDNPVDVEALKGSGLADTVTLLDTYLQLGSTALEKGRSYLEQLRSFPTFEVEKLESKIAPIRQYAASAEELLPLADELLPLAERGMDVLKRTVGDESLSDILPGEGRINVGILSRYLNAADELIPLAREVDEFLRSDSLSFNDTAAEAGTKLADKLEELLALYDRAERYIPIVKNVIGTGEDRLYMLVAQNSAEIRALGGFPGSCGFISITDGILVIEDFVSCYSALVKQNFVTQQELDMFGDMIVLDHDAVVDPYLPIVASRWAENYETAYHRHLNGILSLTPVIVQDLLGVGEPITLSDGTVLDGTNTMKYLQSDVYAMYLREPKDKLNDPTDALFAETVDKTMEQVFGDMSVEKFNSYLDIIDRRTADRVIMLWLEDEEGERLVAEAGFAGDFNTDPKNPQLGVFVSNYRASKLGWYLDLPVTIGEGQTNADGSVTYDVTVILRNVITNEEVRKAPYYVVTTTGGEMWNRLYFATPAGAVLHDFKYTRNADRGETTVFPGYEYYGTMLHCTPYIHMFPGDEMIVTFQCTTAVGAAPLTYVSTPTLTEFRK